MRREHVRDLLARVADGAIAVDEALERLAFEPAESLGFATIDHHRALRQGFPEVIFGEGKATEHLVTIASRIAERGEGLLVTRLSPEAAPALSAAIPAIELNALGRTAYLAPVQPVPSGRGSVLILTAGTSDLPVAEEAAVTATALGNCVARLSDVGVAGIHRLLSRREELLGASVIIVVAGMDGALPSVVGGLVRVPVIAVPTSVGYGASFKGMAALLGMLNSCASNVSVVNIDNGFGAGYVASLINRL